MSGQRGNGARRPVTVLHCRSSAGRHGPERALLELVPALHEQGVEASLLALYRRPVRGPDVHPWVEEARAAGVPASQILDEGTISIGVVRRLARRIGSSGADVLHTHDYKTNILGGLVARRAERAVPWVATVHLHTTTTARLRLYRALDLFLLRLADRVTTVSRDQRRLLLRRGVDRHRVVLIPNVIDADGFAAAAGDPAVARHQLDIEPGVPVVTLVGRLAAQKGVDDFLVAAREVARHRPEAIFLVVGGGPLRNELELQSLELGLDGGVRFLGYRSDVAPILAASDVVVLPSRSEGLPVTLLEAMAVARPVVATPVGGVPALVRHGESGLLVPPDAPHRLASEIQRLIDDPALAARLGEAARREVRVKCSPGRAARRMASVYRTVLGERG